MLEFLLLLRCDEDSVLDGLFSLDSCFSARSGGGIFRGVFMKFVRDLTMEWKFFIRGTLVYILLAEVIIKVG